ncbi:protein sym-1 [Rosa sericea]
MTMTTNLVSLTRTSPFLNPFVGGCCSRKPILHSTTIAANRVQSRSHSYALNSGNGIGFRPLRFSPKAVSDDGSNGSDGNSGGGNNHGRGEGGGGGGGEGGGKGDDSNWSFLSWYLDLLAKYPVSIKALTSAFLTLIGDVICQLVIDQVPCLDVKRTFLFTLLGLVLVGPTLHFWYLYLSKLVTLPGASGAFMSLLLDQFLFSPIFIGVFLSALMTLEGRPSQMVPKLQQEWFSAVLANWQLWIPFQFLNFRFVPQQFQVLAANVIALVWNVILSFKAHKEVLQK